MNMVDRELTTREREIFGMIPDTDNVTFRDIVEEVRRDTNRSRYKARKQLRHFGNQ